MRAIGGLAFGILVSTGAAVSAGAAPMPDPHPYYSHPSPAIDVSSFHDDLSPYGDWLSEPDYGPVWVPHVESGWRPYTSGQWAWTDDYGWLWVSDDPYGWAVYHYGRWYPSSRYGWAWVPGYDWAPAWVAFRSGGGYYGWAPLPPEFGWDSGAGFRVGNFGFDVALDRYVAPRSYVFVPEQRFLDPVPRYVLPPARNEVIIRETRNVTDYRVANNLPVNRGIPVAQLQRAIGRPVPTTHVVDVDSVAAARRRQAARDEVPVFRPTVRGERNRIATRGPAQAEPRATAVPRDQERQRQSDARREEARQRDEQRRQQQADERRQADQRRQAEQQKEAEARKQAADQRELQRRQQAEARQQADQRRQAEQHKQADERRQAAQRRQEDQQRRAQVRQQQEDERQKQRQQQQAQADRRAPPPRRQAQPPEEQQRHQPRHPPPHP